MKQKNENIKAIKAKIKLDKLARQVYTIYIQVNSLAQTYNINMKYRSRKYV